MGENVFMIKDLFTILVICFWFCSALLIIKDLEESILKLPFLKMGAVVVIAIVSGPFFVIVNGFEYLLDAFLPDNGDDDES